MQASLNEQHTTMRGTLEALRGLNAYPIPQPTLEEVAVRRGLHLTDEATRELLSSKAYQLATADILMWLSLAPNVSQGGQSYALTDGQRKQLEARANEIYRQHGETASVTITTFGYKGSKL